MTLFATPERPDDGGIVAVLKGSDPTSKGILLLGHLDVVTAKRSDWKRDPFKLVEENGFYFARGSVDNKSLSAIWADALIRLKQAKFKPRRTIKMALTCGEENASVFNGARWLAQNRPDLIAADFVLNEGGGGRLDADGRREALTVQVGEKASQNFLFTATNVGGHSSAPPRDNAIYDLAGALRALEGYDFPVKFTATTRDFFAATAKAVPALAQPIARLLADPNDAQADAAISRDKALRSTLRTTCVATLLEAGHAANALPQRATANINCRIFPGETIDGTLTQLKRLAGPRVTVTTTEGVRPLAVPPPLDPKVIEPMRQVAAKHFPGVPLSPKMSTGATDSTFFGPLGIPVYGVPGILREPDLNGVHGLDERIRMSALYEGRDYLYDLIKRYVGGSS